MLAPHLRLRRSQDFSRLREEGRRWQLKRRLRAAIRSWLPNLPDGVDIVVIARPSAAAVTYQELVAELGRLFESARLLEKVHLWNTLPWGWSASIKKRFRAFCPHLVDSRQAVRIMDMRLLTALAYSGEVGWRLSVFHVVTRLTQAATTLFLRSSIFHDKN
jgi:RNase P protein component